MVVMVRVLVKKRDNIGLCVGEDRKGRTMRGRLVSLGERPKIKCYPCRERGDV